MQSVANHCQAGEIPHPNRLRIIRYESVGRDEVMDFTKILRTLPTYAAVTDGFGMKISYRQAHVPKASSALTANLVAETPIFSLFRIGNAGLILTSIPSIGAVPTNFTIVKF